MAVLDQVITSEYAIYNGDCIEVMQKLPTAKIHATLHSPPFGGLFCYSSSDRDLSNCSDYQQFFEHYRFAVKEIARITMPGRMAGVHCMDVPSGNTGTDYLTDFPGDLIRMYQAEGFDYIARYCVWKEPLAVRLRTMAKNLAHQSLVKDSSRCSSAAADYLLVFRRKGENPVAIEHPNGLTYYAGSRQMPADVQKYKGWTGLQIENRFSHWIWRQYASAFWDDVRINRVLPFKASKDENDEKHVHPLQLDVIDRFVQLWTNPGETLLTPFLGVGSEAYGAVRARRKAIGIELKPSYFAQSVKNMQASSADRIEIDNQISMELADDVAFAAD